MIIKAVLLKTYLDISICAGQDTTMRKASDETTRDNKKHSKNSEPGR